MKLNALKVNSVRAQQGAWVSDIPNMDDLRLKVRGFTNTDYSAFMAKQVAAVPRDQREGGRRDGAPSMAARDALMIRGINECILLDWSGLTDEAGEPIPYSKETAAKLMSDPDFRPFLDAIAWAAGEVEAIESDRVEAIAPN